MIMSLNLPKESESDSNNLTTCVDQKDIIVRGENVNTIMREDIFIILEETNNIFNRINKCEYY